MQLQNMGLKALNINSRKIGSFFFNIIHEGKMSSCLT